MNDTTTPDFVDIETPEEREALMRLLEYLKSIIAQTTPIVAQQASWLLASLLAVNGGGLLLIFDPGKLPASVRAVCGVLWLAGLALALIVGVVNVIIGNKGVAILGNYIGHVERALITGQLAALQWEQDQQRILSWQKWPWGLGGASAACFLIGAAWAGTSIARAPQPSPAPTPTATDTHTKAAAQANHSAPAVP